MADDRWQTVMCARCHRTYQCTPVDDHYRLPGQAENDERGFCFRCLLLEQGWAVQVDGDEDQAAYDRAVEAMEQRREDMP